MCVCVFKLPSTPSMHKYRNKTMRDKHEWPHSSFSFCFFMLIRQLIECDIVDSKEYPQDRGMQPLMLCVLPRHCFWVTAAAFTSSQVLLVSKRLFIHEHVLQYLCRTYRLGSGLCFKTLAARILTMHSWSLCGRSDVHWSSAVTDPLLLACLFCCPESNPCFPKSCLSTQCVHFGVD